MRRRTVTGVGVGLTLLAIGAVAATGQVREAEPTATLGDVVRELRQLRADLRDTATGQLRQQTLVTRVLVQEQRLRAVTERLDEVNHDLDDLQLERQVTERLARQFDPDSVHAARVDQLRQREQRLQARAKEYAERIAEEQARWAELNAQLDAAERSLVGAR